MLNVKTDEAEALVGGDDDDVVGVTETLFSQIPKNVESLRQLTSCHLPF